MRGLVWSLLLGVEQEAKKHVGVYEVLIYILLVSKDCWSTVYHMIIIQLLIYTELQANPTILSIGWMLNFQSLEKSESEKSRIYCFSLLLTFQPLLAKVHKSSPAGKMSLLDMLVGKNALSLKSCFSNMQVFRCFRIITQWVWKISWKQIVA